MNFNQTFIIEKASQLFALICLLIVSAVSNPSDFEIKTFRIDNDKGIFTQPSLISSNIDSRPMANDKIIGEFKRLIDSLNKITVKNEPIKGVDIIEKDFDEYIILDSSGMNGLINEINNCDDKTITKICCSRNGMKCSLKNRSDSIINQIKIMSTHNSVYYLNIHDDLYAFVLQKSCRNCITHYFIKMVTMNDLKHIQRVENSYYMGYSTKYGFCTKFPYLNGPEIVTDTNEMSAEEKKAINELNSKLIKAPN